MWRSLTAIINRLKNFHFLQCRLKGVSMSWSLMDECNENICYYYLRIYWLLWKKRMWHKTYFCSIKEKGRSCRPRTSQHQVFFLYRVVNVWKRSPAWRSGTCKLQQAQAAWRNNWITWQKRPIRQFPLFSFLYRNFLKWAPNRHMSTNVFPSSFQHKDPHRAMR